MPVYLLLKHIKERDCDLLPPRVDQKLRCDEVFDSDIATGHKLQQARFEQAAEAKRQRQ